jgi:hypothetical protein
MCFFHKWSRWVQYNHSYAYMHEDGTIINKVDARQYKKCMRCGKTRDVLIRANLRIPYGDK